MSVATKDKAAAVDPVPPRPKRANPRTVKLEGAVCQRHFHKAEPGVSQDDVRSPHYFGNQPQSFHRHDIIRVIDDEESWELELCVERVLRDEVHTSARKVYARQAISMVSLPVDDNGEFRCEYRGGKGFCVVRNKDDHPVIQGHSQASNAIAAWRLAQPRPVL